MDFLNKALDTVTKVGKEAADKAKDVTELAKLNMELRSKEDFINRQYVEIGKKVYETEKDSDSSAFEEVFLIKQTYTEIEELKAEIADAKGLATCPSCGARMKTDASYCPSCGAKVEKPDDVFDEE